MSQWTNSKGQTDDKENNCFANAQTSQALYVLKWNFKELSTIKLNLEEYKCLSRRWQRSSREIFWKHDGWLAMVIKGLRFVLSKANATK